MLAQALAVNVSTAVKQHHTHSTVLHIEHYPQGRSLTIIYTISYNVVLLNINKYIKINI
jgi:hypothetical protein